MRVLIGFFLLACVGTALTAELCIVIKIYHYVSPLFRSVVHPGLPRGKQYSFPGNQSHVMISKPNLAGWRSSPPFHPSTLPPPGHVKTSACPPSESLPHSLWAKIFAEAGGDCENVVQGQRKRRHSGSLTRGTTWLLLNVRSRAFNNHLYSTLSYCSYC